MSNDTTRQEHVQLQKNELVEWLRERIGELEEELRRLRALLELLEGRGGSVGDPRQPRPGERVEEVRVGKRRVARVFRGEGYVRLAALEPLALPGDVREYIEGVVAEIRASQARRGRVQEELATLEIRTKPDGSLEEIIITNVRDTLEQIKAKAALKHTAETAYLYTKAAQKGE